MQLPIEIRLKPSNYFFVLLALLVVACLAAIYWASFPTAVSFAAVVWAIVMAWDSYRRHYLLRARSSIIALRLADSGWSIQTADNEWHEATLQAADSTITANLICLSFTLCQPRRYRLPQLEPSVCLFSDSAKAEHLRALRVALLAMTSDQGASDKCGTRRENSIFGLRR